jgi:hypothetical protein
MVKENKKDCKDTKEIILLSMSMMRCTSNYESIKAREFNLQNVKN